MVCQDISVLLQFYSISSCFMLGDFKMLYQNIIKAYSEESSSLIQKGLNGRHYYDEKFSKKRVIDSLVKIFNDK